MTEPTAADAIIVAASSTASSTIILQDVQALVKCELAKQKELEALIIQTLTYSNRNGKAKGLGVIESHTEERADTKEDVQGKQEAMHLQKLKNKVEGYKILVEALCQERPAVSLARLREKEHPFISTRLPLKTIRFLEILPWHPFLQSHILSQHEVIFDWQCLDSGSLTWKSDLVLFPSVFQSLPTSYYLYSLNETNCARQDATCVRCVSSSTHRNAHWDKSCLNNKYSSHTNTPEQSPTTSVATVPPTSLSLKLRGLRPASFQGYDPLLTDSKLTKRIVNNTKENVFSLPCPKRSGEAWKWIGRWTLDIPLDSSRDPEDDGWTYMNASELSQILVEKKLNGTSTSNKDLDENQVTANYRVRKWTRKRVLTNYPAACESTQRYLQLLHEKASALLATQELQERLQETIIHLQSVQQSTKIRYTENCQRLSRYQHAWEKQEEDIKMLRYGQYRRKIEQLVCRREDITTVLANDEIFRHLKQSLRHSGAITNAMLQQGIHFYIQDYVRTSAADTTRDAGAGRAKSSASEPS